MRSRRRHPAGTMLSRYLDADLSPAHRAAIERHVRDCLPCRRMLDSLSETVRLLATMRVHEPAGEAERTVAALAPRLTGRMREVRLRAALRFTVPIALLLGAALSLLNKGGMLLHGQIDLQMCAVCSLNFLLPFAAMNALLLVATKLVRSG